MKEKEEAMITDGDRWERHKRKKNQLVSRYSDPFHTDKRRRRRRCVTPVYDPYSHDRRKKAKKSSFSHRRLVPGHRQSRPFSMNE